MSSQKIFRCICLAYLWLLKFPIIYHKMFLANILISIYIGQFLIEFFHFSCLKKLKWPCIFECMSRLQVSETYDRRQYFSLEDSLASTFLFHVGCKAFQPVVGRAKRTKGRSPPVYRYCGKIIH